MTAHLRPVERPLRWVRLETRDEIRAWAAERRETLTRLCREEGLGEYRKLGNSPNGSKPEPVQLELGLAA
jgi:hypothetical protein